MKLRLMAMTLLVIMLAALICSCNKKPAETTDGGATAAPVTTNGVTTTVNVTSTLPVTTAEPEPSKPIADTVSYTNPMQSIVDTDWYDYGCGDPFVMRHNGTYYLYCSTRDREVGIYCWSSKNMVDWTFHGNCLERSNRSSHIGAYAPEVFYADGKFYLYTSPAGNGHYVFEATSPTGPFKLVTKNFGLSIDGSVFIDDDGSWYFYRASGSGITVHTMKSPTEVNQSGSNTGAYMNGWTEGSMLIKHDGVYFITYTGNHVLNDAYRIDYAYSSSSPTTFTKDADNPLLISTEDGVAGIGHSSTVKGPDLDSYYIVYHVLVGRAKEGMPSREAYFDRLSFNGTTMTVLGGPTTTKQIVSLPNIYTHFDSSHKADKWMLDGGSVGGGFLNLTAGGSILSKGIMENVFTAEFNMKSEATRGEYGAYFVYVDENNYGKIGFDLTKEKIKVTFCVNGSKTEKSYAMPKNCGKTILTSALQSLQVERNNNTFTFYFNDRLLGKLTSNIGASGQIGYYADGCDASFGFVGASDKIGGNASGEEKKPIPGVIDSLSTTEVVSSAMITMGSRKYDYISGATKGDKFTYAVQVAKTGKYDFAILCKSENGAKINVYVGDKLVISNLVIKKNSGFATEVVRGIELAEGGGYITLEVVDGTLGFKKLTFAAHEDVDSLNLGYSASDNKNVIYTDGKWAQSNGALDHSAAECAKRLYGSNDWGDYTVEAKITCTSGINAGLLVRVHNPGTGGMNHEPDLNMGTDYIQGYFVGLSNGAVVLGKQNYSWKELAKYTTTVEQNKTYTLKVEAIGASIKVYLDGKLVIDYTDEDPWLTGSVGYRCHRAAARFDDFKVTPASSK